MIIKGLKRLSTPLPKSNNCIKRKETTYLFVLSFLTDQNLFVLYMGTTAAGITLNDENRPVIIKDLDCLALLREFL